MKKNDSQAPQSRGAGGGSSTSDGDGSSTESIGLEKLRYCCDPPRSPATAFARAAVPTHSEKMHPELSGFPDVRRHYVSIIYFAALVVVSLAGSVSLAADGLTGVPAVTVLHCPHLLDTQDGKLVGESTIVVEGQRIKEVLSGRQSRPGAIEIELNGTAMPGLIDCHTHLTSQTSPTRNTDKFRWNIADYAVRSTSMRPPHPPGWLYHRARRR